VSSAHRALGGGPRGSVKGPTRRRGPRHLHGSDLLWSIAFVVPYAAMFLAFAVYPIGEALWTGGRPSLFAELIADPVYLPTLANTVIFAGIGVNLKMFLALLLSGFFMRRRWWTKPLLAVYVLPWALAGVQAAISFHWMLIGEPGLIDRLLSLLLGLDGPAWFGHRWLALVCNIIAYTWKWMPFWTLIFIAGRMAIPPSILDAAEIDGASGWGRFVFVTFPLLANLYLVCTLLSAIWMIGEFTTVFFVSGGGPVHMSEVLATLGFHYAYDLGDPGLAVAAAISALPLLIPILVLLMRALETREVRL
jgi:multiple sugar transport system permease protein